ncbi:MAG: hypothetical protein KC620_25535, partial [Myxococcales bacterium]|nr:hypothetical protein [Myxococcales bacterium]
RGQLETRLSPRLLDGDAHQALLTRLDRREATGVPGPTRAVHAALVYASCRGAIVIGAAGNRADDDADANGPLLPGGWEALPAPDAETCRALGVSADPLPQPGDERPLIWAAGGIDEADEPIANARPDGEPKLVIAGPNALGVDPAVDDSIPPLTGSSAAAAAVSGTAALVWSLAPDMPTDEVMARVYNSGRDLGRPAAFCLNRASGCGEAVHRVSPCLAVGGACVAPLPTAGLLAAIEMALDALGLPAGNAQPAQPVPVPACGGDTFAVPGLADGYKPCPSVTELDVKTAPWVSPQPSEPMCPTCAFYGGSGKLFVNLAPHDAANSPYTNLTLVVTTASGDKWYSISSSITPGTSLVFTGLSTAGALKSRVEAVAEKMVMGAPLDVAVTDTVITSP